MKYSIVLVIFAGCLHGMDQVTPPSTTAAKLGSSVYADGIDANDLGPVVAYMELAPLPKKKVKEQEPSRLARCIAFLCCHGE